MSLKIISFNIASSIGDKEMKVLSDLKNKSPLSFLTECSRISVYYPQNFLINYYKDIKKLRNFRDIYPKKSDEYSFANSIVQRFETITLY